MIVTWVLLLTSLAVFRSEAQIQGRSCTLLPERTQGRCISIQNCPHLLALHARFTSGTVPISELRRFLCPVENNQPLVCCASQSSPPNPPPSVNPRVGSPLLPKNCGTQGLFDRIISGQPAPLGAWPWVVVLRGRDSSGRSSWTCGGTLISDRYVLTAAHCVSQRSGIQIDFARIGEHTLQQDPDCTHLGLCAPQPQDIPVERVIRHPWHNIPCNQCNDIALLRLSTKVTIDGGNVEPICLPLNPKEEMGYPVEEFQGETAWAAGWGTTSNDPSIIVRPNILQQVLLRIQNLPFCDLVKNSYPDKSMVICAGGDGGDTCRGDSGGPLTLTNRSGAKHFLVGITSKGPLICGAESTQGTYTSVHHYIPWIIMNLQP